MKKIILCSVVLFLFCSVSTYAIPLFDQIPFKMKTSLLPGTYTLRFSIWDAVSKGGLMVWSETHTMTLTDGYVLDDLGDITPLPDLDYTMAWYVQVDLVSGTSYKALSKTRERLNVSQYSVWSLESISGSGGGDADTVDGQHASSFASASHTHNYDSSYVNVSGDKMIGNLVMDTGSSGDLTLSEEGISRAGDLTFDANSSDSDTTINMLNSDGTYKANLNIEGNITAANFSGDGSGLNNVTPASHNHSGNEITSGTVGETYIDAAIARDTEVATAIGSHTSNTSAHHTRYTDAEAVSAIKSADGSGSTLDADLLDGNDSTAFAGSGHTHNYDSNYVNVSGDTMTGNLSVTGAVDISTSLRTPEILPLTGGGNSLIVRANDNGSGNGGSLAITAGDNTTNNSGYTGGNIVLTAGGFSPPLFPSMRPTGAQLQLGSVAGGYSGGTAVLKGGAGYNVSQDPVGGNVVLDSGGSSAGGGPAGFIQFKINGSEIARIHNNNNVGIGITNPAYKLDVSGSINASSSLCIAGNCKASWPASSQWTTSGSDVYFNTGNVGIGTGTPGAKLDVSGGAIRTNNQFVSTVSTGTAPLQVSSTTMVSNLNSEMVGGYKIADLDTRYGQTMPAQIPKANTLTTMASANIVGLYSSITIGVDGLPVMSYFDQTKSYLVVAKCANAACTSVASSSSFAAGSSGHTSIAIGSDGIPVVSHIGGGQLYVAKCADANCSTISSNTPIPVGATGYTSIAIGTDGYPVVAFLQGGTLMTVKCANAACTSQAFIGGVQSSNGHISIAVGVDGLPVISNMLSGGLYIGKCANTNCTGLSSYNAFVGSSGYTSIAIGFDGLPVISNVSGGTLYAGKCANTACSTGFSSYTGIAGAAAFTSIALGMDGAPSISYYTGSSLGYVKCGNASCSANNTITTVDASANVGQYNSITIGTDGMPVMSHYDGTSGDLKFAKCANQFCINNWSRR